MGSSPTAMMCDICHDACCIPVRITCFPCFDPADLHCHAIKRFCEACVRTYLQLNRPLGHRSTTPCKCLYCPSTVDLNTLDEDTVEIYEKDFLLMSMDPGTSYPCDDSACPFKGSQIDLNRHHATCEYRPHPCPGCTEHVHPRNVLAHIRSCPGYEECPRCHQFVYRDDMASHLSHIHAMAMCDQCHHPIPIANMNVHAYEECPERQVMCEMCDDYVLHRFLRRHRVDHLSVYRQRETSMLHDLSLLRAVTRRLESQLLHHPASS